MEQLTWKIKLVILWFFQVINSLTYILIGYMETGLFGQDIGPGMGDGTSMAIITSIMLTLALLSFVLKPEVSRWPNIVFGALFFILKSLAVIGFLAPLSPGIFINELVGTLAVALIVWYGWKTPSQGNNEEIT